MWSAGIEYQLNVASRAKAVTSFSNIRLSKKRFVNRISRSNSGTIYFG